ncbi:cobalamin biosynthesis protein [Methanococcoides methylutens]|uniref:Cobalamin biosynthesis protein CbiG n=1 Tax=Methanococcoides methylutens MM1 TaxID=1434104 RepID=A0A0E3WZ68_METMT|nr:cobalamin biosynthesis protein [Methanococcoides methylutens]AKB84555.1 Cobalamin biosynthesis protein CbiG [Methanococcoides methylutens MM1]
MYIGIGARRGVSSEEVVDAVKQALEEVGKDESEIKMFASSTLKENETGLIEAINDMGFDIKFLPDDVLNGFEVPSDSQASRFGLKGVAEPAALALSANKKLILEKKVYGRITIAIAE